MKNLNLFFFFALLPMCLHAQKKKDDVAIYKIHKSDSNAGGSIADFIVKLTQHDAKHLTVMLMHVDYENKASDTVFSDRALERSEVTNLMAPHYASLLGLPLHVTLNDDGLIADVTGWEAIEKRAFIDWKLDRKYLGDFKIFGNELISQLLLPRPEKPIGYGLEWQNPKNAGLKYKAVAIKGALVDVVVIRPALADKTGYSAKYTYNTVRQMIETAQTSLKVQIADSNIPPFEQLVTINMTDADGGYPDTARLNMAMIMRYGGEGFKDGVKYDSVKLLRYFAQNDARFENDAVYRMEKLAALQHFGSQKMASWYDREVINTPTHLILNNSVHLYNKLQSTRHISPDTTYVLSELFAKKNNTLRWFQDTYAQAFLPHTETPEENKQRREYLRSRGLTAKQIDSLFSQFEVQKKNSYRLLELYHNTKNADLKARTEPIYLWVQAQKNIGNKKYLAKTADAFMKMNDEQIQKGNSARYALLVYKMLIGAGDNQKAANLLKKYTENLERLSEAGRENRFENKNILAYGYYLAAQAEKDHSPARFAAWLKKASQASPQSRDEKAHASFYDRVFLNSKESYRDDYIAYLVTQKDKAELINVFSELVRVNPEQLDTVKKLYLKHYPSEDFKRVFTDQLIAGWKEAPAFTLKKLEGDSVELARYRNKWLVLDFWGTWCGPCREEMPKLNQFYKEVANGQHPGVDFLSIACYSPEEELKSYLSDTKYELPILLSTRQVVDNYQVYSFPSKILIAPNGKMLRIDFGKDWLAILKQLQANYLAAN